MKLMGFVQYIICVVLIISLNTIEVAPRRKVKEISLQDAYSDLGYSPSSRQAQKSIRYVLSRSTHNKNVMPTYGYVCVSDKELVKKKRLEAEEAWMNAERELSKFPGDCYTPMIKDYFASTDGGSLRSRAPTPKPEKIISSCGVSCRRQRNRRYDSNK